MKTRYIVTVRNPPPPDLQERIALVHASAIQASMNKELTKQIQGLESGGVDATEQARFSRLNNVVAGHLQA
jgi:hypothetical protein